MSVAPIRAAVVIEQLWQRVPGGSGTYITELLTALADRGDVAVTGVAARHDGRRPPELDPRVDVRWSHLGRTVLYPAWQHLGHPRLQRTADGPADVVHATTWAIPPTGRALVVTVHDLAFLDAPTLFTSHGNAFFRRALRTVVARADAVIVPSDATAAQCVAAGVDGERIHVIPHGMTEWTVTPEQAHQARARYAAGRRFAMWAGTVEPRKNVPRLIAAFERVASRHPDVDLLLVGPTGWGDAPSVPSHLAERVRFTGHVPRGDLHGLYAATSAFVFPSLSEGFGLPVLEAMSHGAPVITSKGTACAEVADDAGVLVDPNDVEDIAGALDSVLTTWDTTRAEAARARARTFRWARSASLTVDAYRAAIQRRRRAA